MTNQFNSIALLIPAYNPDESMVNLINELEIAGFSKILIVNDGSRNSEIFSRISSKSSVVIIHHEENRGKGAALKTGFHYLHKNSLDGLSTIITVDADGQHLADDVVKIAQQAVLSPEKLVLGVRDFSGTVPARSAIGNLATKLVLSQANNINVSDTQTGLRAIPKDFAIQTLKILSNRYEFELECILLASKLGISIHETSITTVYINNNKSSHFRPLMDSVRIYSVFIHYIAMSLFSVFIDISIFALSYSITSEVFTSTYFARSVSAIVNFLGNKYLVFKSRSTPRLLTEAIGYIGLAFLVASLSAVLVNGVHLASGINIIFVKLVIDTVLFFMNYLIQKQIIFRKRAKLYH